MSVGTMRMRRDRHGKPFPLPSGPLLRNAGVDAAALRDRYREEFREGSAAPRRVWYPVTSSTLESDSESRRRIELWYTAADLSIEGSLEEVYRATLEKPFETRIRSIKFRTKRGADGAPVVQRFGTVNSRSRVVIEHEVLGFELTNRLYTAGSMYSSLSGAAEALSSLDAGAGLLSGVGLSNELCLVDEHVLEELRRAASSADNHLAAGGLVAA